MRQAIWNQCLYLETKSSQVVQREKRWALHDKWRRLIMSGNWKSATLRQEAADRFNRKLGNYIDVSGRPIFRNLTRITL